MARQPIAAPIARRIYDRLYRHMNAGVYLGNVATLMLGIPPSKIPTEMLATPIVAWCAAYPSGANLASGDGSYTSGYLYRGNAEVVLIGGTIGNDHEAFYAMLDTADDLVKIIGEDEQETAWGRLDTTVVDGETIALMSNEDLQIEWPTLALKDDETTFYHMAICRWSFKAMVTWT